MSAHRRSRGVTLIEMVIVIALIGIIGTTIGGVILPAIQSYEAQKRRAALVDSAESALRRMARDIRIALPHSLRITNTASGFALEMIPTVDGGRYCVSGLANCNTAAEVLNFAAADTDFEILGCFRNSAFISAATAGTAAYRLVINNSGNEVYTAAGSPAVITPAATTITLTVSPGGTCGVGNRRHSVAIGGGGHQFSSSSTRQRLFAIQSAAAPVSYICDASSSAQTLNRYAGYAFAGAQPTNPLIAPLSAATSIGLVTGDVSGCSITTTTSDVQNRGLVTLELTVERAGETVRLIHQVQLDNSR